MLTPALQSLRYTPPASPTRNIRHSSEDDESSSSPSSPSKDSTSNAAYSSSCAAAAPSLWVLDQLLLPTKKEYVEIPDVSSAWRAIRTMQIRGSSLIALVATLSLVVDLHVNVKTLEELDEACHRICGSGNGKGGELEMGKYPVEKEIVSVIKKKVEYLRSSRPTFVELSRAMDGILNALNNSNAIDSKKEKNDEDFKSPWEVRRILIEAVTAYAQLRLEKDVASNEAMAVLGAERILNDFADDADPTDHRLNDDAKEYKGEHQLDGRDDNHDDEEEYGKNKISVMTMGCTGSLATGGYGTALGVLKKLNSRRRLQSVAILETRPYNEGSRLTSWELTSSEGEKMPNVTLLCDSMAASFLKTKRVDACLVGADVVCGNGDTVHTIGSYSLAVMAAMHNIPFYVICNFEALDISLRCGDEVEIEQRPPSELWGTTLMMTGTGSGAPQPPVALMRKDRVDIWNPALDVTPASFINAIVTERGVVERRPDGTLNVVEFVSQHTENEDKFPVRLAVDRNLPSPTTAAINFLGQKSKSNKPGQHSSIPRTYAEQSIETLPRYLAKNAPLAMKALCATSELDLSCIESGNDEEQRSSNLIFLVSNDVNGRQIWVKQALPYARREGEAWPLSLDRAYYEYRALRLQNNACPDLVPEAFHFSRENGLVAMEYVGQAHPSRILRKGLMEGRRYPFLAEDMGRFCAHTLFKTSAFKLSATELRKQVEFWSSNTDMCALTEQVVFTEPYIQAPNNRWTSPELDDDKRTIENDTSLKIAAARLKNKFVGHTQALLHADLHSGSILCSPGDDNDGREETRRSIGEGKSGWEKKKRTAVINPEFGFYGPMAFDTGAFIAGLLLSYVSQPGQNGGEEEEERDEDYANWILEQIPVFWNKFCNEFSQLWNDPAQHTGDCYQRPLFASLKPSSSSSRKDRDYEYDGLASMDDLIQGGFFKKLFRDTLGFAGMKMLRRIVGMVHAEELDSITDREIRVKCERHGLDIAKELIKNAGSFATVNEVVEMASHMKMKRDS